MLSVLHPFDIVALAREQHVVIVDIAHISAFRNISFHRAPPQYLIRAVAFRGSADSPVKSADFPCLSFPLSLVFPCLYESIILNKVSRKTDSKNGFKVVDYIFNCKFFSTTALEIWQLLLQTFIVMLSGVQIRSKQGFKEGFKAIQSEKKKPHLRANSKVRFI